MASFWRTLGLAAGLALLVGAGSGFYPPDPPLIPICEIQGDGYSSPYHGQTVRTRGVVTLDLDDAWQRGFYLQDHPCDGDPDTSDGIYVYLGGKYDVVSPGDLVEVQGEVDEYWGLSEVKAPPGEVTVLSHGETLPPAVDLNPPVPNEAARAYFESLEGMRAELGEGRVVGPTDSNERTWLVRSDLGLMRVFHDDPAGTGEVICVDDGGPHEITPPVKVGDLVQSLVGVLDYRGGLYCLQLTTAPLVLPAAEGGSFNSLGKIPSSEAPPFRVATFNLANLFDTYDDPATEYKDRITGPEYQRRLHKRALAIHDELGEPDLIAVQEAETQAVLQELVAQPEILAGYGIVLEEGPDRRGLDIGLLYRLDRVEMIAFQVRQGCTTLVDGLGPDGDLDMGNPHNDVTCDSDGDDVLDGNRLFSRPPLVAHLRVCPTGCPAGEGPSLLPDDPFEIWMIDNHWKSKSQDTSTTQYTLPRRVEQAGFVAGLVDEILAADPGADILVLGDLNDYIDSSPLSVLRAAGLANLLPLVERPARYTYIYHGLSQVLDHVLMRSVPGLVPLAVTPAHVNADYPYAAMKDGETVHRSSDHDPVAVEFGRFDHLRYLPLVVR